MSACEACEGIGYFDHDGAGYGKVDVPDGWIIVTRCDECARFNGDDTAAIAAMRDHHATTVAFWYVEPGDPEMGDYAIKVA